LTAAKNGNGVEIFWALAASPNTDISGGDIIAAKLIYARLTVGKIVAAAEAERGAK
jgi:hypothetical protein